MTIIVNTLLGGRGEAFMVLEAITDRYNTGPYEHWRARHLREGA